MGKRNQAEAEVKFVLQKTEFDQILDILKEQGFRYKSKEELDDYFIEKIKSRHKGWDFKRLRAVDQKKFLLTVKKWVLDENKNLVRLEDERHISKTTAQKLLARKQELLKISKVRVNFKGSILENNATVSIDDLKINGRHYYFLEVEILTTLVKSAKMRSIIKQWAAKKLEIRNTKEALSILDFISHFR